MPKKKKATRKKKGVFRRAKKTSDEQQVPKSSFLQRLVNKLFDRLFGNQASLLYSIVISSPFFIGFLVSGSPDGPDSKLFVIAAVYIFISKRIYNLLCRAKVKVFFAVFLFLLGLSSFYYFSANIAATFLFAFALMLSVLVHYLNVNSVKDVFLLSLCRAFQMSSWAVLGVYVQINQILGQTAVLGLIPAFFISAATIVQYTELFLKEGWRKEVLRKNRKDEILSRPGSLARTFSLLLILAPSVALVMGTFNILPLSFLSIGFVLVFTPSLAAAYQKDSENNQAIFLKTSGLSLLAIFVIFLAGLFA